MVDYAAWASADTLTVEQAAYLWAGIDPSSSSSFWTLTSHERAAVAPRLQMIQGAIAAGELAADSSTNAYAAVGNFVSSLVRRGDLMKFAEARGERPAFLFPPARIQPPAGSPGFIRASELPSILKDSKLLQDAVRYAEENMLQEAMKRAELRVNMQHAERTPVRSGNRSYDDAAAVAKVVAAVKQGEQKSYLAAATAIVDEIKGAGSPVARIKRIAAKASKAVQRSGNQ
jgi:hypothetical protein